MVMYTRRHYIQIGNTIKKLPRTKRVVEYRKWSGIFKKDNPRYDSARFKAHIGL